MRSVFWLAVLIGGCEGSMESMATDAGPGPDGDTPGPDAGPLAPDAGSAGEDAGRPAGDAGPLAEDAGRPPAADAGGPTPTERVFEEVDGRVAFEAEHYADNDDRGTPRAWLHTSRDTTPDVGPDPDPPHVEGASGGEYLEGLPDTRVTHDDPLVNGESFFGTPGTGPTLTYRVRFTTPGRYFVWARAVTTGTEDNGVHVGLDDEWPSSGARMQWCGARGSWLWSSAQRDSGGSACGVPRTLTLDVPSAGEHLVRFSMREDGFELDKIVLALDEGFAPEGEGPPERLAAP